MIVVDVRCVVRERDLESWNGRRIRSWPRARQRTMRSPRRRRGMEITSNPSPREPCSSLRFRAYPRTGSLTSLVSRPHSGHRSGGGWSAVTNLNPQWGHDSSRTGRSSGAWGSSRSGSWFTMSHVLFSCVVCQYTDPVAAGRNLSPVIAISWWVTLVRGSCRPSAANVPGGKGCRRLGTQACTFARPR